MMKIKRAVMMAVLAVAIAALAIPLVGVGGRTAEPVTTAKAVSSKATAAAASLQQNVVVAEDGAQSRDVTSTGKITAETMNALGIQKSKNPASVARIASAIGNRNKNAGG